MPVAAGYGLTNYAPMIFGGSEKVGNVTLGVQFIYNQALYVDVKYTNLFGPSDGTNTTDDRDFISLTAKYTF